ncbi:MAG: hypothetical protein GC161_00380 [Planctomycetaceae bacterium]|nr:hypothetical protein [Planctomycetaceae bacterium]
MNDARHLPLSPTRSRTPARWLWLAALALCTAACASHRGPEAVRYLEAGSARELSFDEVVERLVDADMVALGELHDSGPGHAAQLALTRAIVDRRGGGTIALEQFERDVQDVVDAYVDGRIERDGLAAARPWKNHDEHYHAVLELARELDLRVVAANAPRELASRVGREGAPEIDRSYFAPRHVQLDEPEYRARFEEVMGGGGGHGGHGSGGGLSPAAIERFFAAQVVRDESMAEAISDAVARRGEGAKPVVLWCGRFHSDYGLGTVSRVASRRPDWHIKVVSMERRGVARELARAATPAGSIVIEVP